MQFVLLYSDICIFTFLGLLAILFLWARRRGEYREAARRVISNRFALICFFVICLYGTIAILDSIHYRTALEVQNNPTNSENSEKIVYGNLRSALDSILLYIYDGIRQTDGRINTSFETTYSAPLADKTYDKIPDPETGKWHFKKLKAPSKHLWGTDKAGGDVFYRLLKGIRTALIVGLITTMLAVPFAMVFGVTAGYFGGKLDDAIQFIYITLGSIPSILLISALMIIVRNKFQVSSASGIATYFQDDKIVLFLCGCLGLISWSSLCRLLRGETLKIRELDYVKAARALGVNDIILIIRHIIPNVIHVVIISSILRFSGLVMVEAILAYINIGVPSTIHSWGRVVDGAREQLARDPLVWWPVVGAFLMMFFLVLSINIFGDAVRDALDPRLRE